LRRKIEPGAILAVFDLDNPKVGIKRDFPPEPLLRRVRIDGRVLMRAREQPFDAGRRGRRKGLRRRLIECRAPVQVIDFDENGAGLGGAPATEDGACAFHSASTQIGRDPDVGTQAQRVQCPAPRAAWVSCLTSRSVISVAAGNP
jgi:hypothetical protein